MVLGIKKLHLFSLLGFVATLSFNLPLPFTNAKLNNIFLVLFAASVLLLNITSGIQRPKRGSYPFLLLFISPYIIFLISLLFTDNYQWAVTDLTERKIGLLAFPFLILFSGKLSDKSIKTILLTFVFSCLGAAMYCLLIALYQFYVVDVKPFLTYHELSLLVGMHAIYQAMFNLFSIIILVYLANLFKKNTKLKVLYFFTICFFILSIFLLAARTHIFLLVAASIGYFTYRFAKKTTLLKAFFLASLIGSLIVAAVFLFPQNRERFKQLINYKGEYGINSKWGEQQMRPLIWRCAAQLITDKPLLGHGIGDVQDEMHQCYIDNEFTSLTYFEGVKFNAHNQYLEMTLGAGFIGLAVFIATLLIPLFNSFVNRKLYFFFLLLFLFSCFTESFFERQIGVAFYAFFNSFLFFTSLHNQRESIEEGPSDDDTEPR